MRVLALAYTYYLSDPRVIRASEAIAAQSDLFEILCLRRANETKQEDINGVTIRRLPIERYRGGSAIWYVLHYLRFFLFAMVILSVDYFRKRYDIIHVHNMPEFLVFSTLIPRLFGAKVILDMHDLMPETFATKFGRESFAWRFLVFIEWISLRYAHQIITVHEIETRILIERGVPAVKMTEVMNVPDPKIFYPRQPNYGERFTIIYHGIVAHRQGLDLVVRSLVPLIDEGLPLQFVLIGEGDHLPEVRRLSKELGLDDVVKIITPYVPVTEIPEYLRTAKVGVAVYRNSESTKMMLPVKILEYMAMGLPVIVSRLETTEFFFDDSMFFLFLQTM